MTEEKDLSAQHRLLGAVEERRKKDPLIGARIGAKEVYRRVSEAVTVEGEPHDASLLCALGALAGYACQASLRMQAINRGEAADAAFMVIATQDGKRYFYGEQLNWLLAEARYSVWSVAAGAARHAGCTELPDIGTIFKRVAQEVGSNRFGVPCLPRECAARRLPVDYLQWLWPVTEPVARLFCHEPEEWPLLFGLAVQEAIYAVQQRGADPGLALTVVMESAVPMSKIMLSGND